MSDKLIYRHPVEHIYKALDSVVLVNNVTDENKNVIDNAGFMAVNKLDLNTKASG
jgi:hypothetical protein